MKLHALRFIIFMRILKGLDHEFGAKKVNIIRKHDLDIFCVVHMFLDICKYVRYIIKKKDVSYET